MPGGVKRKSTDPKLLLVQSEGLSLSELDSQYRLLVEGQQGREQSDSELTPTFSSSSQLSQDLLTTPHSSSYTSWTKPVQVSPTATALHSISPTVIFPGQEGLG